MRTSANPCCQTAQMSPPLDEQRVSGRLQTKQILERLAPANGHCPNLKLGHYLRTNILDFTGAENVSMTRVVCTHPGELATSGWQVRTRTKENRHFEVAEAKRLASRQGIEWAGFAHKPCVTWAARRFGAARQSMKTLKTLKSLAWKAAIRTQESRTTELEPCGTLRYRSSSW